MDLTNPALRFARAQGQLSSEFDGEVAILNLNSKRYFGLTDVGALIWRELASPRKLDELVEVVCAEYEIQAPQCRDDILEFLATLNRKGMLATQHAAL